MKGRPVTISTSIPASVQRFSVAAAPGAVLRGPAAEQAGPWPGSVQLPPVGAEHIQVKEPPEFCPLLQAAAQRLERFRRQIDHIQPLAAGVGVDLLPVNDPGPDPLKLAEQQCPPDLKASPDGGAVFDRPRNVHRKGHQRQLVFRQQRVLPFDPAVPRGEHLCQFDKSGHVRTP